MEAFGEQIGRSGNLPEQLFGDSFLEVTHDQSGIRLRFDALSALQQWHADKQPALQVAGARAWQESRAKELAANNIATLQYDWYHPHLPQWHNGSF